MWNVSPVRISCVVYYCMVVLFYLIVCTSSYVSYIVSKVCRYRVGRYRLNYTV